MHTAPKRGMLCISISERIETKIVTMYIRPAKPEDMDRIMEICDAARSFMRKNGNHTQWINGYPSRQQMAQDRQNGNSYVWAEIDSRGNEILRGVFTFILGEDPTYTVIEGGTWRNAEPYGTIHRMGSDGTRSGFFRQALQFCLEQTDNIRIDTHADNLVMQHLAEREGFIRCGTIYVADGSPRIAYHYVK